MARIGAGGLAGLDDANAETPGRTGPEWELHLQIAELIKSWTTGTLVGVKSGLNESQMIRTRAVPYICSERLYSAHAESKDTAQAEADAFKVGLKERMAGRTWEEISRETEAIDAEVGARVVRAGALAVEREERVLAGCTDEQIMTRALEAFGRWTRHFEGR